MEFTQEQQAQMQKAGIDPDTLVQDAHELVDLGHEMSTVLDDITPQSFASKMDRLFAVMQREHDIYEKYFVPQTMNILRTYAKDNLGFELGFDDMAALRRTLDNVDAVEKIHPDLVEKLEQAIDKYKQAHPDYGQKIADTLSYPENDRDQQSAAYDKTINANKSAEGVAASTVGYQVVIFSDIHSVADIIYQGAIKTARLTGRSLGMEFFSSNLHLYKDALRKKEITPKEFAQIVVPEGSEYISPNAAYYLGRKRALAMMEDIGKAIVDGVDIVPLGSFAGLYGMTAQEESVLEGEEYAGTMVEIKKTVFLREEGPKIDANPQKYYQEYKQKALVDYDLMSEDQKNDVADILARDVNTPEEYAQAAKDLYIAAMPERSGWDAMMQNVREIYEKNKNNEELDTETRLRHDQIVAQNIKRYITENNREMVVIYGGAHTMLRFSNDTKDWEQRKAGKDIDGELRKLGMRVVVVDPVATDKELCHAEEDCKPGMEHTETLFMHTFKAAAYLDMVDGEPRTGLQFKIPEQAEPVSTSTAGLKK